MIDKLLAELSKATVWMPTQVLTGKVGARNATNVGLRLKDLEKNGSAVSRSRMEFGVKVIEWRHSDKKDVGDFVPTGRASKAAPVVKDSLTTEMPTDKECCNAAKVVAVTASSHVADLRAQLKLAEQQRDEHYATATRVEDERNAAWDELKKIRSAIGANQCESTFDEVVAQRAKLDNAERLNIQWLGLAREFHTEGIDGLRNLMKQAIDAERQWEIAMMAAIGEDGTGSVTEAIAGLKETVAQQRTAIDAKDAELGINDLALSGWFDLAKEFECKSIPELRVFINAAVDKLDRLRSVKAENTALTILNESMPGFGAAHKALSGRGYLVRAPKKAPRVFSKRSNAEAAAMASAKQHGTVNVFALVPVGKAVRGAEWREA